jgi:hypothetical protein
MRRAILMGFALVVGVGTSAVGQQVGGTVRGAVAGPVISGAVVTAIDSAGRTLARTLSNQSGRYSLQLPPTARSLRAIRIGFQPVTIRIPAANAGADVDIVMQRLPAMLEAMRVESDASCGNSDDGRLVLQMWEQVRSGLLAAIVAREANPAIASVLTYQRRMEPRKRLITSQRMETISGKSSRPIVAARSAAELATSGYRQVIGTDQVFYAPDADVLFDETFTGAHCFGVTSGTRERAGQIGLTFTSRNNSGSRDMVGVEGTLWVRAQPQELVQLDYRYTGVDPEAKAAGNGGTMHFQTMPNGVVFIDSWSILIPVLTETMRRGIGGATMPVTSVSELAETGGLVIEAAWPDGTRWNGSIGGIRGQVREEGTGLAVSDVAVAIAEAVKTQTDVNGRYSLTPMPPGRYELTMRDTAFSGFTRIREKSREVELARGDTVMADFEIPARATLLADICRAQTKTGNTVVVLGRIGDGSQSVPKDLRVETSWYTAQGGAVKAGGTTPINQQVQVADVTTDGGFVVCGLPRGTSWIRMSARIGRVTVADTLLEPTTRVDDNVESTRSLQWTLAPGAFEAALRGDGSVLSGRVMSNTRPLPNVQVWVIFADTMVVTDSLGRFRIGGLQSGQHLLQLRRLGYDVYRDSVTLRKHEETVREFTMDNVAELDTVRTIGEARKYNVPRLKEFEQRRLSGSGGRFISETELRKNEQRTVADFLRSYVPGIRIVDYRGQRVVSSSSSPTMNLKKLPRNGPPGCWVSIYLDGIMIFDGDSETQMPPDMNQFFGLSLSGVEYYGSGANIPVQFKNLKNNCGTLLLWTRGR